MGQAIYRKEGDTARRLKYRKDIYLARILVWSVHVYAVFRLCDTQNSKMNDIIYTIFEVT